MAMTHRKKILGALSFLVFFTLSVQTASAWIPNGTISTIANLIHWQDDSPHVVIITSNGDHCYFNSTTTAGKNLLSVVLAYYLSAKRIRLFCHDATSNINGINAHLLHRIGAE
jgi:hypothetical protein